MTSLIWLTASQLLDQAAFFEAQCDGKTPREAEAGRAVSAHGAVGGELKAIVDQNAGFFVTQVQGDRVQGDRVVEQLQTMIGADYARENGQGMMFAQDEEPKPLPVDEPDGRPSRSRLTVVK